MKTITDFENIIHERDSEGMVLFYFSRPSCGVCSAIKPKVISMMEDYPEVRTYYVNLDEVPEAAGQLSVMTIPAILAYADGKEVLREARYISMDDLEEKISRPYSFIYGD